MMSTTMLRVVSSVVVIFLVAVIAYFWGIDGLVMLSIAGAIKIQIEYAKMLFLKSLGLRISVFFVFCCMLLLGISLVVTTYLPVSIALISTCLFVSILLSTRDSDDVNFMLSRLGSAALGIIYCVVLPYTIISLLFLEKGAYWFVTCGVIVFSGDIASYFTGRKFGGPKISPTISPQKTWSGAYGGLVASCFAGTLSGLYFFPEIPFWMFSALSIFAGAQAQTGDFFESVIKRVAGVKDSGTIMPGHGGLLDRLDGLLFAAPLVFLFAQKTQTTMF